MKTGFVYDDIFLEHQNPSYHPESANRLIAIKNAIENNAELKNKLIFLSPEKATKEDITAVHDEKYYEKIMSFGTGYLDSDTYMSPGTPKAALYAAGAVITAVNAVMSKEVKAAFCAVRPPGHHAERDEAMGFCIFNNVAVGAAYALRHGFKRVFVIDFDVHHGNGTEHIFYTSPNVFFFSTHQSPLYPGTGRRSDRGEGEGEGTNFNYPLPPHSGDREIIPIYRDVLPELIAKFDPELLFVSAGYDLRDKDPLASLEVTREGIREIIKSIIAAANKKPLIFSLEGGYNLNALAESVIVTLEELVNQ